MNSKASLVFLISLLLIFVVYARVTARLVAHERRQAEVEFRATNLTSTARRFPYIPAMSSEEEKALREWRDQGLPAWQKPRGWKLRFPSEPASSASEPLDLPPSFPDPIAPTPK